MPQYFGIIAGMVSCFQWSSPTCTRKMLPYRCLQEGQYTSASSSRGIMLPWFNVLGKTCEEGLVHQVPQAQGCEHITLDVKQV